MPVTLSPVALVSLEEGRAAVGKTPDPVSDDQVVTVINMATALAENVHCHRMLRRRTLTTLRLEGPRATRQLYPATVPIDTAGTIAVMVNGAAQTLWKSEADGDPDLKDVQAYEDHFYRHGGWAPTGVTQRNVLLTYAGGYEPVPDDLKEATVELIQKLWGPLIEGRMDYASVAGPGGSLQTLDGQWAGGTAGTSYSLSRRSDDVFKAYRRVTAG